MKNWLDLLTVEINSRVADFPNNKLCQFIDSNELTTTHYHAILKLILHQTMHSSNTFAISGGLCSPQFQEMASYLFHHAEEEKDHYKWILEDLKNTGYKETSEELLNSFPAPECQAYIAFNYYTALKHPYARLGIAAMLESIGGNHSKNYATKICTALKLKHDQAKFFFGHGDTDVGHTQDILKVLKESRLTEDMWKQLINAATTGYSLYKNMYDHALDYVTPEKSKRVA